MDREKFDKATEINKAIEFILENRKDLEASLLESISVMVRRGLVNCNFKIGFDFESMKIGMIGLFRQCYDNEELDKLKKEFEEV